MERGGTPETYSDKLVQRGRTSRIATRARRLRAPAGRSAGLAGTATRAVSALQLSTRLDGMPSPRSLPPSGSRASRGEQLVAGNSNQARDWSNRLMAVAACARSSTSANAASGPASASASSRSLPFLASWGSVHAARLKQHGLRFPLFIFEQRDAPRPVT